MKLIPKVGAEDVRFGMSLAEVLELLGPPTTEQLMSDVDTHPKQRCVLNYVKRGFLVTPELGVMSVEVEAEQSEIQLWDTPINDLPPGEFANLLANNGCEPTIKRADGWGDQEVEGLSHGIIASFSQGRLESIEVHDPSWRESVS